MKPFLSIVLIAIPLIAPRFLVKEYIFPAGILLFLIFFQDLYLVQVLFCSGLIFLIIGALHNSSGRGSAIFHLLGCLLQWLSLALFFLALFFPPDNAKNVVSKEKPPALSSENLWSSQKSFYLAGTEEALDSRYIIRKDQKLFYKDRGFDGKSILRYQSKIPKIEEYYRAGLRHGTLRRFNENGVVIQSREYKAGVKTGTEMHFYPNGRPKTHMEWKNNALHGVLVRFFPNGKIKERYYFQDGTEVGTRETYDSMGTLLQLEPIQDGKVIQDEED